MGGAGVRAGRRLTAVAAAVCAVALGLPPAASADGAGAQTVAHQGDVAHSGHLDGVGLAPPLTEAWRADLGGDVAAPVVADGRLFALVSARWGAGATLHAFDLATGSRLWGPIDLGSRDNGVDVAGVAYDDGRLFVTDAARMVRAYDATTGQRLWQTLHDVPRYATGAPVAAHGDVAVLADSSLALLDQATGTLRWRLDTDIWAGSPAIVGDAVVAGQECHEVAVHDRATGARRWRQASATTGGGGDGVAVVDGRVYEACEGSRPWDAGHVWDLGSGAQAGRVSSVTTPAVAGDSRYVVRDGDLVAALVAEDIASGEERWTHVLAGDPALPPLVVDDVVYTVDEDGRLHGVTTAQGDPVVDVATGGEQFHARRATSFARGLGAGDGHLVVPHRRGLVVYRGAGVPAPGSPPAALDAPPHARGDPGPSRATSYQGDATHRGVATAGLDPADLSLAWSKDLGGFVSHPIIADGRVIVTVEDGASRLLRAFDRRDGTTLWGPLRVGQGIGGQAFLAYADGTLFVLEGEGRLRALDPATGGQRWTVDVPTGVVDGNEGRLFRTPPIAAHGRVYALGIGLGGVLTAVDQDSGVVEWQTAAPDGGGLAADDDHVYVGAICSRRAVDPDDGAGRWVQTYPCGAGGDESFAPAVADGRVYGRDSSRLGNSVLDAATGEQVGTFATHQPFAIDGSRGFFLADGALRAVDLATGVIAWERRPATPLVTPPLVVDGTVYVGDDQGLLTGLSPETGAVVWSGRAGDRFRPTALHGVGTMTTLGAAEGVLAAPAWHSLAVFATGDGPPAPPEPEPEAPSPRRPVRERAGPDRGEPGAGDPVTAPRPRRDRGSSTATPRPGDGRDRRAPRR